MRKARLVSAVTAAMICCGALAGCAPPVEPPTTDEATVTSAQVRPATAAPSATPEAAHQHANSATEAQNPPLGEVIEPPSGTVTDTPNDPAQTTAPHCIDEQLTLGYNARPQDSGAGNWYADLVFTNVSANDCSFDGWPGLIVQDTDGAQLGTWARIEGATSETVVLGAGRGVATANLHGTNPGAYGCPSTTSATLRAFITPDGTGPGVAVAQEIAVCSDDTATLGIGPLVAG